MLLSAMCLPICRFSWHRKNPSTSHWKPRIKLPLRMCQESGNAPWKLNKGKGIYADRRFPESACAISHGAVSCQGVMMHPTLERLIRIVPPPKTPVDCGNNAALDAIEAQLGLSLPPDYEEYIATYGD